MYLSAKSDYSRKKMDAFAGLEGEIATKFAFALQGTLVIFFVISPLMGKLIHHGVAKVNTQVLVVCTMLLIGNLTYMGMIYIVYPLLPQGAIHEIVWIMLSFSASCSLALLIGRYINWMLNDNLEPAVWVQEYENLTEADMMPFDRRRKREMERRKQSRHD
jgi:hypothetical protein